MLFLVLVAVGVLGVSQPVCMWVGRWGFAHFFVGAWLSGVGAWLSNVGAWLSGVGAWLSGVGAAACDPHLRHSD